MEKPVHFSSRSESSQRRTKRAPSPAPSGESLKSDWSMHQPVHFSSRSESSQRRQHSTEDALQTHILVEETGKLEQDSYTSVDDDVLHRILQTHRTSMKNKYESLCEGFRTQENKTLLNRVYTQLYIIGGQSEGVNEVHEVIQMEKSPSKQNVQDNPINCNDIFEPSLEPRFDNDRKHKQENLRTVLTKGIAGIGKTVSVQKFILDWAEGKANKDVDFMFVFPFRELNLVKDNQYSVHKLLCDFYPEITHLDLKIFDVCKVMFIFDGLDESRIPLNLLINEKICEITKTSSVGVLMSNLIKGELLPSALIWITSRPAAANQIPPQYIHRVTEIQGFNDPQKEEYLWKRISDKNQATKIISHIKTTKSLHIMCHIPVFCWISATVLQEILKQPNYTEIPKTLTDMYAHFLCTQLNIKNEKYKGKTLRDPKKILESNRSMILKLAELAFKQLMKGNVMFYEEDLRECSIDVTEASMYSGICTEIFREESVLYQKKIYCFVHLSFQEFLAAFYMFHCYITKSMGTVQEYMPHYNWKREWLEKASLEEMLERSVRKTINNQNGHLDLFLRFLLGISLESNQRLLQGLLTHTCSSTESINKTAQYIKLEIQTGHFPAERSINLFLCLMEMKDNSLSRQIQDYLQSDTRSEADLSPAHCTAIACILQMSEEVMDELDLKKYETSEEGYRRLIPAASNCRKALLAGLNLNSNDIETLCSTLKSSNSSLRELDLSYNYFQEPEVKLLCEVLQNSPCKLQTLKLVGCNLTVKSSKVLTSVLQTKKASLKELDISYNDLQNSEMDNLSSGLKSLHCKLEILRLASCNLEKNACENLGSVLQLANNTLRNLDLSNNVLQDSGVKMLADGLMSSHCKLEILILSGCLVTEEGCASLASALRSNPSHLKELDLTYNHPGESGVKLLSGRLKDPQCRLETLRMEHAGEVRVKLGLRKYACELTLDPNTAHTDLSLSEGNRKVTHTWEQQSYPDHPKRFDFYEQVLSTECLSGRCYWEAEWSGDGAVIAVTYKGISRKGGSGDCEFGWNVKSWSLNCSNNRYTVWHNKNRIDISMPPSSSTRVGVYLDWAAGTLSFYSVSSHTHILTHLHTFLSTFTEPLYAGFCVFFLFLSVCV